MKSLGIKIFSQVDQDKFANLSKDYNQIHISKLEARKLIFGRQIVHGINVLLTGLNFFFKNQKKFELNSLNCTFYNPIFLKEKINFILEKKKDSYTILAKKKKLICAIISLNIDNQLNFFKTKFNKKKKYLNRANFSKKNNYKYLKKKISKEELQDILATSYIVGMVSPGKYSLYSQLIINFKTRKMIKKRIYFFESKVDNRINQLQINLHGTITAKIYAFRYNVFDQKSVKHIKKKLKRKFLQNKKTLIIGASRGLGEVASKISAVLGSNMLLTYNLENKNILKIKKEIIKDAKVECDLIKLNILKENYKDKKNFFKDIDYCYYFPTPKIVPSENNKFNNEIYMNYKKYYLDKFVKLSKFLNKVANKKIKIFYPSSIYLNKQNKLFMEYVKAKMISEKKIKELNNKLRNIKIEIYRLPEMNTSQNIKILNFAKNDNEKIMLRLIKKFI